MICSKTDFFGPKFRRPVILCEADKDAAETGEKTMAGNINLGRRRRAALAALLCASALGLSTARADETCNSPFMTGLYKGAGAISARLDARRKRRRRRVRQARDDRRHSGVKNLWPSDPRAFRRRPRRGASHGLHRRPQTPLGGAAGRQQDLRLRRGDGPFDAKARKDHRQSRGKDRLCRAPHFLRPARARARAGAFQQAGPRRPHGSHHLQQCRRSHRDDAHAG